MENLRKLSLVAAIALTTFVLSLVFLALFNSSFLHLPWKDTVLQFQTFLGGLSVLAASLFAYHGNTAMVQEVARKNDKDEQNLKQNILIKASLAAEMMRQQSHARLCDLKKMTNDYWSSTRRAHVFC